MFAFAIWDENRRELFAARDHLGQKPFFYVHRGDHLLFASEIKGLLALDPSLREMDLEALDQYLTLRIIASPKSMFKDIKKLPPAHFLRFQAGGQLMVSGYWNLNYEPKHGVTEEELVDELEERAGRVSETAYGQRCAGWGVHERRLGFNASCCLAYGESECRIIEDLYRWPPLWGIR
jgi:asparagine synthetase B (glutamine-hydrolysing)